MKSTDKLFEITQYELLDFRLSDLQNCQLSSSNIAILGNYEKHFLNMMKAISNDAISMYGYDAVVSASFVIDPLDFSIESSNLYPHWSNRKELYIKFFDIDSSSIEDCNKALGEILNNFSKMNDDELFSDLDTFDGLFKSIKHVDKVFENRYNFFESAIATNFSEKNHDFRLKVDFWEIRKATKQTKALVLSNSDFKISVTNDQFELKIKDTILRTKTMSKSVDFLKNSILNVYNSEFDTDYVQMKDFLDVLEMKLY